MRIALNIGGHIQPRRHPRRSPPSRQTASPHLDVPILGPDALTCLTVWAKRCQPRAGRLDRPIYGRHPLASHASRTPTQPSPAGSPSASAVPPVVVEHLYGDPTPSPTPTPASTSKHSCPPGRRSRRRRRRGTHRRGQLDIEAPGAPPVLVAGLGPKCSTRRRPNRRQPPSDVGPNTIADQHSADLTQAATDAGRPSPRILAESPPALPTTPTRRASASAAEQGIYGSLPAPAHDAGRGRDDPADLVIAGHEDQVAEGLQRYATRRHRRPSHHPRRQRRRTRTNRQFSAASVQLMGNQSNPNMPWTRRSEAPYGSVRPGCQPGRHRASFAPREALEPTMWTTCGLTMTRVC